MRLLLLNAQLAEIYGLPVRDISLEQTLQEMMAQGWKRMDAEYHIACAIMAGAYTTARDEEIEGEG